MLLITFYMISTDCRAWNILLIVAVHEISVIILTYCSLVLKRGSNLANGM